MRGHRQIVKARMVGYKPAACFIDVGPAPRRPVFAFDGDLYEGALPQVWTDGADPGMADLRWANAMRVHLSAPDDADGETFARWFDALLAAGARIVGVCAPNGTVLGESDIYGEAR